MEKIRIQDDLYNHVNGEWLEKAVIPDDKPVTGGFADLGDEVEEKLIKDFNEMLKTGNYPNATMQKACELFALLKDTKKRNKDGFKPAYKDLDRLYKINNMSTLNRYFAELNLESYPLPFDIGVDVNMTDTLHHMLVVSGPEVILPDTTYYKEEMKPQHDMILGIWQNMATAVLKYTKLSEEEQALYIADTIKFDAIIATLVKSQEEWSEYTKIYNPMKTTRVATLLKPIKFKKVLEKLFGFVPETTVVADPRFLKGFKTLFNEENFELYKHWAYVKTAISATSCLSEELRDIGTSYRRALTGVQVMPSAEKMAYQMAGHFYSQPIGLYYGEKYFGEEAKKDVIEMVHEIIDTYKIRVAKNDFLGEETKQKAILKLDKMVVKMGYPDKCEPFFETLDFNHKNAYEAIGSITRAYKEDNYSKLAKDVDRTRWVMPGHMVNACYNPMSNDITFPAAILQAPFYSIKQTRSQNLGGIGAVIGHEISHAFDNNGAKCDENGNLHNWWTKEDNKNFVAKTKAMIKEFDGIELPWGKVNGKFTVSENIADNGGMAVTLEIMSKMKEKSYEEYFINWARIWALKAKPEYLQLLINIDVHGPAILRANMQPRNFQEWYDTFGVKKTDKMYIAPNKRVTIW